MTFFRATSFFHPASIRHRRYILLLKTRGIAAQFANGGG
jgi:hypothetical protein